MTAKDMKLLVLDLDETLVYSAERELDRPADLHVVGYHVYKRPHLDAFFDFAFSRFKDSNSKGHQWLLATRRSHS